MKRLSHDKELAKYFELINSQETLMETARRFGYDFTREDLKHAFVTLSDMSDAELGGVMGGVISMPWAVYFE